MGEPGRIPPLLRLCRGCRHFIQIDRSECDFCGGNVTSLEGDYQERLAEMRRAANELRDALSRRDELEGLIQKNDEHILKE